LGAKLINRVFIGLVMAGALAAMVACGPATQPSQTTGGVEPPKMEERPGAEVARERGGKQVMVETSAFGNPNDPHLVVTATGRVYSMPVVNWLLKRDIYQKGYPIIGDLAKSWDVSKDGLKYTFKLQEGVKFHNVAPVNGREFTSEDVKYNLLRLTADPSVTLEKWKPRFQRAVDFGKIKSIETPDKYTAVINLEQPYAPFIDAISHPGTAMLPKEFVETFPEKIINEGMIGTGPFMPGTEYKNQQIATYKKNPGYWKKDSAGGQLPYLDELTFLYFGDIQSELAAFRARQIDSTRASSDIKASTVESIKKDQPGIRVFYTPTTNITNYRFNMKFKPFQDVKVRRAIHLTVDRHQYVDLLLEGAGTISGPVTSAIYPDVANTMDWLLQQPGYRKDKTQDIEEAKRLMKEAGYGDGFEVGMMTSTGAQAGDTMALLQDQLKPLKITIKPEQVDYAGQWLPRATQGEFEFAHMSHTVTTDVDSVIGAHLPSGAPRNYGKFSDPVLDELVKKELASTTPEERKKWAQEAEMRIFETAPMIFLYTRVNTLLAQPWVHNAGDGPVPGSTAYMVEQLWVEKH